MEIFVLAETPAHNCQMTCLSLFQMDYFQFLFKYDISYINITICLDKGITFSTYRNNLGFKTVCFRVCADCKVCHVKVGLQFFCCLLFSHSSPYFSIINAKHHE